MSDTSPLPTKAFLINQAKQDPGLPRPQPTASFWQQPPHPSLADTQSPQLPPTTGIAIIGSGITGCSVVKHLLDLSAASGRHGLRVTVLEARTLTSGATGRNGGLLTSFVPEEFGELCEHYGSDEAIKMARFANRNLENLHELTNSSTELKERSQVRRLKDVICYSDHDTFVEAKESWTLYEKLVPEERGKTEFYTPEEAAKKYNVRASAGAIVFPNGACWPYRLITNIWSQLYDTYKSRLSIETSTPVQGITYAADDSAHQYILSTPRGIIRATQVIHATNGHTGHLLPNLRGIIYPLRGSMSVQKSTPAFGDHGDSLTWSMVNNRVYDVKTDILEAGTYYAHQNVISGDIFIGGEKTSVREFYVADDSEINPHCADNFKTLLPRYFINGWSEEEKPDVKAQWTGIMGFTGDRLPLVGRLSEEVTQRGEGEWIAAGFNGYGMSLCWSCGEALAKMVLGMDADFLPAPFLVTRERVEEPAKRGALDAVLGLLDDDV